MKTLFQNMDTLDPCLVRRVVDLLSYHLSNNMWRWPWQSWGHVLEVRFVVGFHFIPISSSSSSSSSISSLTTPTVLHVRSLSLFSLRWTLLLTMYQHVVQLQHGAGPGRAGAAFWRCALLLFLFSLHWITLYEPLVLPTCGASWPCQNWDRALQVRTPCPA